MARRHRARRPRHDAASRASNSLAEQLRPRRRRRRPRRPLRPRHAPPSSACRVLLADENPAPGGQIYRAVTTTPVKNRAILGEDYWRGEEHRRAASQPRKLPTRRAHRLVASRPDGASPGKLRARRSRSTARPG